jgi:hypothetical protein
METFPALGTVVVKFIPKWCPAWWRALLCDSGSSRRPLRRWCLQQQGPHQPLSDRPPPPPSAPLARTLPHTLAWHSCEAHGDGTAPARLPGPGSYFLFRSALGRAWDSARSLPPAGPCRGPGAPGVRANAATAPPSSPRTLRVRPLAPSAARPEGRGLRPWRPSRQAGGDRRRRGPASAAPAARPRPGYNEATRTAQSGLGAAWSCRPLLCLLPARGRGALARSARDPCPTTRPFRSLLQGPVLPGPASRHPGLNPQASAHWVRDSRQFSEKAPLLRVRDPAGLCPTAAPTALGRAASLQGKAAPIFCQAPLGSAVSVSWPLSETPPSSRVPRQLPLASACRASRDL